MVSPRCERVTHIETCNMSCPKSHLVYPHLVYPHFPLFSGDLGWFGGQIPHFPAIIPHSWSSQDRSCNFGSLFDGWLGGERRISAASIRVGGVLIHLQDVRGLGLMSRYVSHHPTDLGYFISHRYGCFGDVKPNPPIVGTSIPSPVSDDTVGAFQPMAAMAAVILQPKFTASAGICCSPKPPVGEATMFLDSNRGPGVHQQVLTTRMWASATKTGISMDETSISKPGIFRITADLLTSLSSPEKLHPATWQVLFDGHFYWA